MENDIQLPENVTQAREAAQSASERAAGSQAASYTIEDELKSKVLDLYSNNQDIIEPLDVATQDYLQAPQVAREQYQDVFNPFARERLVSQYIGNEALPMLSLSSIAGQRFGRVDDTIGAGTRAFQAQVAAEAAAAERARQNYVDLLGEYTALEELRQAERQLDLREMEINKPSGGGGGGESDFNFLDFLGGGGTVPFFNEPMPEITSSGAPFEFSGGDLEALSQYVTFEPLYDESEIGRLSPQGQWIWTRDGWQPRFEYIE